MTAERERGAEIEELLGRAVECASGRPDVRGLALVGSEARGCARLDSDVDLVVLTEDLRPYLDDDRWLADLEPTRLIATRRWGQVTERRLARPSGLEIDVGFAPPSWATTEPLDPGTNEVVSGGMSVLYDPDRVLVRLLDAC